MPKDQPRKDDSPLVELQTLFPIGGSVRVKEPYDQANPDKERAEVKVHVRALSARETAKMLAQVTNILAAAQAGMAITQFANDHFDEACDVLAIATGREAAWLGDLDNADFLRLWKGFTGANADFFLEAAGLYAMARRMGVRLQRIGDGPTASSTSTDTE